MRQTRLNRVSIAVSITLVCAAVLFALVRTFALQPAGETSSRGSDLFQSKGCTQCHYAESKETRVGPGLKGLFERESLPVSGRKVTAENVRRQFISPYKNMPSFEKSLTAGQMDLLIAYLKTL